MALGADRRRVLLWVAARGLLPAIGGLLFGLVATLLATRAMGLDPMVALREG